MMGYCIASTFHYSIQSIDGLILGHDQGYDHDMPV